MFNVDEEVALPFTKEKLMSVLSMDSYRHVARVSVGRLDERLSASNKNCIM